MLEVAGDEAAFRSVRGECEHQPSTVQPSGNRVRVVSSAWSRFEGDAIREIHFQIDALSLREHVSGMTG